MLLYTPGEWWRYVLLLNGTLTGLALEVVVKDSAPAFFKVCSKGLTWCMAPGARKFRNIRTD